MIPAQNDTIVALSTALSQTVGATPTAPRAIVRLSGKQAKSIAVELLQFKNPGDKSVFLNGKRWTRIETEISYGENKLPCVLYVMPGPHSYTRQDVVEMHVPGYRQVIQALIGQCVEAGARAAQPGEFTRRALLNGRISAAQAEAVGRLIHAQSAGEARAYAKQADSKQLSEQRVLLEDLQELLSLVELGIDFSQEDVELIAPEDLKARLENLVAKAERIATAAAAAERGRLETTAPLFALVRPSNAGKSSLLNALTGSEQALSSAAKNTTRDTIEINLTLSPEVAIRLVDTAGLGGLTRTQNAVPSEQNYLYQQAVEKTNLVRRTADVLILTFDDKCSSSCSAGLEEAGDALRETDGPVLLLWTKADLNQAAGEVESNRNRVREHLAERACAPEQALEVSIYDRESLTRLKQALLELGERAAAGRASAWAAQSASVRAGVTRAAECLRRALTELESDIGEDALVIELREAVHALNEAEGILLGHDSLTESLLDRIFSGFCIGK